MPTNTQQTPTRVEQEQATKRAPEKRGSMLTYLLIGTFYGIVFTKAEVISWFRIQEMFRFQSFHMYGILGSAVLVGVVSVALLKALDLNTLGGEKINISSKKWGHIGYRYWIGGIIFGVGWALLGACPGPIYVLIGAGYPALLAALLSALAGTWAYGYLRPQLPHY